MHDNRENGRAKILGKSKDFFFFWLNKKTKIEQKLIKIIKKI